MRFYFRGLTIGGAVFRHHVALSISVPLASFHRRSNGVWSWTVGWQRYRPESGCRNCFYGIHRQGIQQRFVMIHMLGLGQLVIGNQYRMIADMRARGLIPAS
jgi:hypothetical protein